MELGSSWTVCKQLACYPHHVGLPAAVQVFVNDMESQIFTLAMVAALRSWLLIGRPDPLVSRPIGNRACGSHHGRRGYHLHYTNLN